MVDRTKVGPFQDHEGETMRNYSSGYVTKHGNTWRAVINWQEDGNQKRLVKNTGVRCYEDRTERGADKATRDNRGKSLAETVLRD